MSPVTIDTVALRKALFDSGPDAVLCVDSEGDIIAANPRAAELFGYDPQDLLGLPIEQLVPGLLGGEQLTDRQPFFSQPKARSMGTGLNVIGRRKDGSEFPAAINLNPQVSNRGAFVAATVADITELREAEDQLRESEELYRHLIENTPDGYFLTVDGVITFTNASALRLFGATEAAEILGRSIGDFTRGGGLLEKSARLERRQGSVAVTPFLPMTMLCLDGSEFEAEVSTLRVPGDDTAMMQTIIRDLTSTRQAEQLRIRALAAEESERLKSNLLSTVSHELRTPLTAVRGYATTVLEYAEFLDAREILDYVGGIDTAAQQLEKIVSDLLTLSRIEGGVYRLDRSDFELREFVRRAVDSYRVAAPGHEVQVEGSSRPAAVNADSSRVLQVLHNLFDNARKYGGEAGATRITVSRCHGEVITSVKDQGPGVDPDSLERIFQPFVRGSSSQTAVAGSGLGLAVCKGIVEAHGGRIWASLPSTGGFQISFVLPASQD